MNRILSTEEVAEILHCTPETVRERTPHDLPGVKFGRDWVYAESALIEAVITLSKRKVTRAAPGELPEVFGKVRAAK